MSREIDTSDLSSLSLDDLKYLHDRNQITDKEMAEALEVSPSELAQALKNSAASQIELENRANTGDANTANLTKEQLQEMLAQFEDDDDEDDGNDEDETEEVDYSEMTNEALRQEIARRNEGREEADQLSLMGKKEDLIATLEADDEADEE